MFTKSIRNTFLLWLTFLLLAVLVGFGITAYRLFTTEQNHAIYAQLQRRLSAVASDLSPAPPGRPPGHSHRHAPELPDESPTPSIDSCETNLTASAVSEPDELPPRPRRRHRHDDDFDPPEPPRIAPAEYQRERTDPPFAGPANPRAISLSAEVLDLFDQSNPNAFYFMVWNNTGVERLRSSNAPVELEIFAPVGRASGPQIRTRSQYVESYLQHAMGYRVLVGRSIATELTARQRFAIWLVVAGGIVLTVGICVAWWLARQALKPVENISIAASRISAGNLSERINIAETDNELGQLATTLNSTFARLEAAFTQQKQFTADASHELRTPLAVMISETQTTLARPRSDSEYRETVETCLATAQQMRKLTESLLELARYDSGQEPLERHPFDLADTTAECLSLVRPLATQRDVIIDSTLHAAPATGDVDRIRQVLLNLISNAIYYNQPGGKVRVTCHATGNEAIVTIADDGIGISAEDLPQVFKRFYRADKARARADGHGGLGLSICKAIVDAHGGQITVASKIGEGSTFTLILPHLAVS